MHTYALRGVNPTAALESAQITPAHEGPADAPIAGWQLEQLSAHAMRELDDEALGWFSRRLPWGSYGLLARASISSPVLGLAIQRWCRHHGLLTDDIQLSLTVQGALASISLQDPRTTHPLREFCHVSVLRNIWGIACWWIDSRIPLAQAGFGYATPPHHNSYAVLFPTPTAVAFNSANSHIGFDARYLEQPLRRDEAALQHMLRNALPLMVQTYRRDRLLTERAHQTLQNHPTHTAQQLADALHVSTRTLHRQLADQGTTLQTLKDKVRRERAQTLLLRTRKPIKQVAEEAGFLNDKSFTRAFKGWTGLSPNDYRKQTNKP